MKNKNKITMDIALCLVELTHQLRLKTGKEGGYGLGGRDGYGLNYENNIFMMHPYCWCEQPNCKWCSGKASNFLYKPTNCEIQWYKWIGRGQEQKGNLPNNWFQKCIESIWDKDDCWYEFIDNEDKIKIKLCFNVSDKNSIIEVNLSPFANNCKNFWSLEDIISDIANAQMKETEEYKKAVELNKQYPKLRERIKNDALLYCENEIKWIQNRINILKRDKK